MTISPDTRDTLIMLVKELAPVVHNPNDLPGLIAQTYPEFRGYEVYIRYCIMDKSEPLPINPQEFITPIYSWTPASHQPSRIITTNNNNLPPDIQNRIDSVPMKLFQMANTTNINPPTSIPTQPSLATELKNTLENTKQIIKDDREFLLNTWLSERFPDKELSVDESLVKIQVALDKSGTLTESELEDLYVELASEFIEKNECLKNENEDFNRQVLMKIIYDLDQISKSTMIGSMTLPFQKAKPVDFFTIEGKKNEKVGITFGHGIITSYENTQKYASIVSELFDGMEVKGCHWQKSLGIAKHFRTKKGITNPNVEGIVQNFNDFFDNSPEDAILVHVYHSDGATDANLALKQLDPERAKRIQFFGIGPAEHIDPDNCYGVLTVASKNDFVPMGDPAAYLNALESRTLIRVKEPTSKLFFIKCHAFDNPICQEELKQHIKKFCREHNL